MGTTRVVIGINQPHKKLLLKIINGYNKGSYRDKPTSQTGQESSFILFSEAVIIETDKHSSQEGY
jgi:hypothetical protein